ncbi:hypothetical protein KKF91_15460 [Myxococcota bacterium]|nr:hypothetical protein [Myxococcota bacterium]MBU1431938.1 hypothetical protein [Myxococcota bacterium]MBU1897162.1 hypothetical protein [Myxococcota bacterium]
MTGFDAEALSNLNDQSWRRLGITQTFDRLLVEAVITSPGSVAAIRGAVGRQLQAGAAKFWDLSFPQIKRDLCRRGILHEDAEALGLAEEFADKLSKLLDDLAGGVSRVEPTPNVTLEDILSKTAAREAAEKAKKKKAPVKAKKKKADDEAEPAKREPKAKKKKAPSKATEGKATEGKAAQGAAGGLPAALPAAPSKELFTSLRINKLLDALDNVQLLKSQLAGRLGLRGADLDHFLTIASQLEITRVMRDSLMNDEMVELHFRGSELAKTSSAERRQVLIKLVKELREAAEG